MTDYIQSMNISVLLSKHNNICVNTKQVFINYKQIMQLLWVIKMMTNYCTSKCVGLNIISLLVI